MSKIAIIGAGDVGTTIAYTLQLSGQYGFSDICLGVPCIINHKGVVQVIETPLDRSEKDDLTSSHTERHTQ